MKTPKSRSDKELEELDEAQRELSTWTLLFHQSVAERAGLHPTDHKCLDLIIRMAPLTAGDLAQLTGLTTGAVTAVVDRLTAHGLVQRHHDTTDRRKVYLKCQDEKAQALFAPIFSALSQRMRDMYASYSDAELKLLTEFARKASAILEEEVLSSKDGLKRPNRQTSRR
jgi:DNA-binding MarR family transcriptional regulator